jgi:major membrane immunogen (membrane-anchored lipoprotein)
MNRFLLVTLLLGVSSGFAQVTVTSPDNGASVSSPVHYSASATSACARGVAAVGIYTAPHERVYVVPGTSLDTNLSLSPGTYHTVVEEWDNCGKASTTPITITVGEGSQSAVDVSTPAANSSVTSPVQFVASATTSCSQGVKSMGIYTAANQLAYTVDGSSLNTSLTLNPGSYQTTVESWDFCGGSASAIVPITVTSSSGAKTFANLQAGPGWTGMALLPPSYSICSSCTSSGPKVTWSTTQDIASPSLSGRAMEFNIGGDEPFSDVLWNIHLTHLLPNSSVVETLHNFTYDVYFYGTNLEASQALEFDINQFIGGKQFTWGHECRIAGGHEWDTWNNTAQHWVPSGIPCYPLSNAWNHLILKAERTSNNQLLFQSITLNNQTYNLNRYDNPGKTSWYGFTVNYQIDGNRNQDPYTVYLDNFNFTYQ